MRYPVSQPSIGEEELLAVTSALRSGWITQGPGVLRFEAEFAKQLGADVGVVACSSGTTALHLALLAAGVQPGDEVLVPDITYVATANAVLYCGAKPVLVDVNMRTWNIDLAAAEQKLAYRTTAIVPVHLYGNPCDMPALVRWARKHSLLVIEDAAEALGAAWDLLSCGAWGDAGAFSFYGNKLITMGEGGAVVSGSEQVIAEARKLRGQSQSLTQRFYHDGLGFNYRLTDVQAAIGEAQIKKFDSLWEQRVEVVRAYHRGLRSLATQEINDHATPAPWLFTGLLPASADRAEVQDRLLDRGIETRPTFVPLHRLPHLDFGDEDDAFPNASSIGDRGLSLPTHPALTPDDVAYIAQTVEEVVEEVVQ